MSTEITQSQVDLLQERIKSLQDTVSATQKKNEEYEQRLKDVNEKQVQTKLDELNNQVKAKDERISALEAQVKAEQTARTDAETQLKVTNEKVATLETEFAKLKAEQTKAVRITQWVERTGADTAVATKAVEKLMKLDDAEFKDFLETQPAKVVETKTEEKTQASKVDPEKVLENSTPEKVPAPLNSGGVDTGVEQARANMADFIRKSVFRRSKAEVAAN